MRVASPSSSRQGRRDQEAEVQFLNRVSRSCSRARLVLQGRRRSLELNLQRIQTEEDVNFYHILSIMSFIHVSKIFLSFLVSLLIVHTNPNDEKTSSHNNIFCISYSIWSL